MSLNSSQRFRNLVSVRIVLNIIVNEKLDEITGSRPRRKPDGDKAAWVQECNDVLTTHGFDPEYLLVL